MRFARRLATACLLGLSVFGPASARQQIDSGLITRVHLMDETGTTRIGTQVRESRPDDLDRLGTAAFFYRNKNVRDEKNRVVSGLRVRAWKEGERARVVVYTLVPRAGVPNAYLARRGLMGYLQPVVFVELTMAIGDERSLVEMRRLGLEPWTLTLVRAPRQDSAKRVGDTAASRYRRAMVPLSLDT
jgi:hypothetical protein